MEIIYFINFNKYSVIVTNVQYYLFSRSSLFCFDNSRIESIRTGGAGHQVGPRDALTVLSGEIG
jgi:hypothetical protein